MTKLDITSPGKSGPTTALQVHFNRAPPAALLLECNMSTARRNGRTKVSMGFDVPMLPVYSELRHLRQTDSYTAEYAEILQHPPAARVTLVTTTRTT